MHLDMPLIWVGIVCFGAVMYVILDGFDLGVGMLSVVQRDRHARDLMVSSIAAVWDGNETWLILVGACLYGAFPEAYSILLPRLYVPIMIMLFALIFRAVSIEMRHYAKGSWAYFWDAALATGSFAAAVAQGLILGALVQGDYIPAHQAYVWWTPFSVLTAFGVVAGYCLLGACWLIMKTHDRLQLWSRGVASVALVGMLAASVGVTYWSPFIHTKLMAWWMHGIGQDLGFMLIGLKSIIVLALVYGLARAKTCVPFLAAVGLFAVGAVALALTFWPVMIPPSIGFRALAASETSLNFIFPGVMILLPLLVTYSGYTYYAFHGKVQLDDGY